MTINRSSNSIFLRAVCLLILGALAFASPGAVDSSIVFDSELLRLKVPDAFQKSSLKLEIFADSSWQLYRGQEELSMEAALSLLGLQDRLAAFEEHHERETNLQKEYRSRRVFAIVTSMGSGAYLAFAWNKGWIYQIPAYAGFAVSLVRYSESRKLEVQSLREQYYQHALLAPSDIQRRVDDYNFRLYQFLSNAGIQFSDD